MVESLSHFPFRQIRFKKYLTLEVMKYVEHPEVLKFMFSVNKETRLFLKNNFIIVRNGFVNEGLIIFQLNYDILSYWQLEELYKQALKREIGNRVITIEV